MRSRRAEPVAGAVDEHSSTGRLDGRLQATSALETRHVRVRQQLFVAGQVIPPTPTTASRMGAMAAARRPATPASPSAINRAPGCARSAARIASTRSASAVRL